MSNDWKRILGGILLLGSTLSSGAQVDTLARRFAKSITENELWTHLGILASDAYQGRDTGKEGQKMAAAYLRNAFIGMGIPPVPKEFAGQIVDGYFQPYELTEERVGSIGLTYSGGSLGLLNGLIYFKEELAGTVEVNEVISVGKADRALDGMDIRGTVVALDATDLDQGAQLFSQLRSKLERIRSKEPLVVITIVESFAGTEGLVHRDGTQLKLAYEEQAAVKGGMQLLLLEEAIARTLFGTKGFKKLMRNKVGARISTRFTLTKEDNRKAVVAENVLAYIEGSDKKDELIIITAHYDHVGVDHAGVVYNGADDDGSGTVALLEIAQAFALAKAAGHGPRRSVLVMPVSGEEKGLLGSRFYSDHPVFPLTNTVADLNIDMIGRVDSAHARSEPYVYVIGSDRLSSDLHRTNERANEEARLKLDYTFNAANDPNRFYYRSDHYNFAKKGIPSIFYFSGVHEDYHQPGDDVEKIRFDLLAQRTMLVFHTAWLLANEEDRIRVDGKN